MLWSARRPVRVWAYFLVLSGMLLGGTHAFADTAYVANTGGSIQVIDTGTNTVTQTIPSGGSPISVTLNSAGTRLYVGNDSAGTVSVYDTTTFAVLATIPVGANPRSIALTADGSIAYVANWGSNTLSKIDTATNTVTNTIAITDCEIPSNCQPNYVAIPSGGSTVYVANQGGSVSVIESDKVQATVSGVISPQGLAASPDGSTLFVPGTGDVISTSTNQITGHFPGSLGRGIAVSPDGNTIYTGGYSGNDILLAIDVTATPPKTIATIPLTGLSDGLVSGIAITPDGKTVYATGQQNTAVIDTASNTQTALVPTGNGSTGIAIGIAASAKKGSPKILFNDSDITGMELTVVAGQQIVLAGQPSGQSQQWEIDGKTDVDDTDALGAYTPTPDSFNAGVKRNVLTTEPSITLYFLSPGIHQVTYSYASAGQTSNSAEAAFNVVGPSVSRTDVPTIKATRGSVQLIDNTKDQHPYPPYLKDWYLSCGNAFRAACVTFHVQPYFSAPPDYPGKFQWVQVLISDTDVIERNNGPTQTCTTKSGYDAMYKNNKRVYPDYIGRKASDSPSWRLFLMDISHNVTFKANMYLEWMSILPRAIPVPLGYMTWSWVGSAAIKPDGSWDLGSTGKIGLEYHAEKTLPVWDNLAGHPKCE
jgi:YVTN family beta-propeller protein